MKYLRINTIIYVEAIRLSNEKALDKLNNENKRTVNNIQEKIIVLDFGGQYNQLIARRVREFNVYCEVRPHNIEIEKIKKLNPTGIIFTGGPNSVYGEDAPKCDPKVFELGIPILGICYGSQLMAHMLGGKVGTAPVSEYGKLILR